MVGDVLEVKLCVVGRQADGGGAFEVCSSVLSFIITTLALQSLSSKLKFDAAEDRGDNDDMFFVLGAGSNSKFNLPMGLDLGLRGAVVGEKLVIKLLLLFIIIKFK